ncbi:hypothetical protein P4S72_28975 [Vibrio sp. PP-XX7]
MEKPPKFTDNTESETIKSRLMEDISMDTMMSEQTALRVALPQNYSSDRTPGIVRGADPASGHTIN